MIKRQRFEFALERLQPGEWVRFEQFASEFLVFDYGKLRTVATASGDLGRDAELFSPEGDSAIVLQYSVTESWETKIRQTAKRIRQNFTQALVLMYVTNQNIGARADSLKKELRKDFKLVLDILDRTWFLDRLQSPPERARVAEALASDVVDPYLASREVVESKAPALNAFEFKAAVLHLQLQWEDDTREKGLTKLCYEGLIKSVLRETSSEKRVKTQYLRESVGRLLPNVPAETVCIYVNSALERLDRKAIRRWREEDEVCLSHEEVLKVRDGLAAKEAKAIALMAELRSAISDYFEEPLAPAILESLCTRALRALDEFLLKKGEEFASAVANDRRVLVRDDALDVIVNADFAAKKDDSGLGDKAVSAVRRALFEILQRSGKEVRQYLRETSDGYTLLGFLRSTPDVQKVVQKIFSDGEIWIDTSVLLPVIAETLVEEEEQTASALLRGALEAGLKLRLTSGVIEEVERHINRCIAYTRTAHGQWVGGVPFLYAVFALTGLHNGDFQRWISTFVGTQRPREDIADYFLDQWGIEVVDLENEVNETPEELRYEVERIWREAHEQRRSLGYRYLEIDPQIIDRLVRHDVECFLGVLGRRKGASRSELGYVHWWLTFDKTVRDFEQKLWQALGPSAPKPPVISPDFLANYLAIGPLRARVSKQAESKLPVAMFDILSEQIPIELLEAAESVRKDCGELDERLLRRKLRDMMDNIKQTRGLLAKGGFAEVRARLEQALNARRNARSRKISAS